MRRISHQIEANGDQTRDFEITDFKAMTFREFIDEVLAEFPNEFGYFKVNTYTSCGSNTFLSYDRGKLEEDLPSELAIYELRFGISMLDRKILSVTANGGWGRMDYEILFDKS